MKILRLTLTAFLLLFTGFTLMAVLSKFLDAEVRAMLTQLRPATAATNATAT